MSNRELISVCLFIIFWWLIYSFEVKCLISRIKQKPPLKSKLARVIHVFAITGIVCLAYGYFIEPYWIDVRHVHIQSDRSTNPPLTVVQISDLHCDKKIRNEHKLVTIINALQPDVIVFTGDALNTKEARRTDRLAFLWRACYSFEIREKI
ncbi:MAG: hypothetical protein KAR32_05040 [Candidatus Omnitrophica bacterium]|nr:hypothetical protein [Candidatus Omnitrophota bacterium]